MGNTTEHDRQAKLRRSSILPMTFGLARSTSLSSPPEDTYVRQSYQSQQVLFLVVKSHLLYNAERSNGEYELWGPLKL